MNLGQGGQIGQLTAGCALLRSRLLDGTGFFSSPGGAGNLPGSAGSGAGGAAG
ncbi:hypothetical protein HMPREF9374_4046, partial [Desmospora sp. 8437]